MRLVGLYIDAYGLFSNFTVERHEFYGNPLLVYGLNEAGKSTFLSFIRGVLFGFKAEGEKAIPIYGGRPGGWLFLESRKGEVYRVQRAGKGNGKVTVDLPDGTRQGEQFLSSHILLGVSPVLFKNIFALGMDELRRMEDLKKEEVSAHIYGAGTGVSPGRLARAVDTLQTSTREIFNPRGRVQKVNKLLKELKATGRRIKQLEQLPGHYIKMKDELKELEEEQEKLAQKRSLLEMRKSRLENLLKARDSWVKMQARRKRLEELPCIENFPAGGLSRLEQLLERRQLKNDALRRYDMAVKELTEALEAIKVDERLLVYGGGIKALNDERSLFTEKRQRLVEAETKIEHLEGQVRERLLDLGPGWDEKSIMELDLSLTAHRKAEDFARQFKAKEEELRDITRERETLQENLKVRQQNLKQIEDKLSSRPVHENDEMILDERFNALEQLSTVLQEVRTGEAKCEGEQRRLVDLQARRDFISNSMQAETGITKLGWLSWLPAALGAAVLLVSGLNLSGILFFAGSIVVTLLAFIYQRRLQAQSLERRHRLQREIEALDRELEATGAHLKEMETHIATLQGNIKVLAAKLQCDSDISAGDLPLIRRRLEQEREDRRILRQLEGERKKAVRDLAAVQEDLRELGEKERNKYRELEQLKERWHQWCLDTGLPDMKPSNIISFLHLSERARDSINRLRLSREEHRQILAYIEDYIQRVNNINSNLNREPVVWDNADSCILHLSSLLEENQAKAEQKRSLRDRLNEAIAGRKPARAELTAVEESLKELLKSGQAKNEEDFRWRSEVFEKRERLKDELERLEENLISLAGTPREYRELCLELEGSGREDNRKELEQVKGEILRLEKAGRQISEQAAEKRLRIEEMENGDELARSRQEMSMLQEQLAREAKEWRVRTLAFALLDMAKQKHERDRQPAVLLEASRYLDEMTLGRYKRVISPVGSPGQLEVERPSGERVTASNLSRGAAGQLYLSLRLALAGHYSSMVAPLPVMLDDIMVDFDRYRLNGAVNVLKEFAKTRQVLLFTCHRHIMDIISQLLPEHQCLSLEDGMKVI